MLTIYYDNQKAIVANEQTKTYKVMPKSKAAEYSKDKQASLKPRLDLVNAMEMLLGFGYEEDKKMKFTKENVEAVINEYFRQAEFESCGDLIAEIHNLDDTPEKVVVKKFVADFYEDCANATLEFLITQLEATYSRSELGEWYRSCRGRHRNGRANAQEVIAKMKLDGYEVEKEPFSWAVKGITDYFKYDGKIIVFKNEEEALEVANLIGINTEVEKMNNIDCQDCISIEELKEETK